MMGEDCCYGNPDCKKCAKRKANFYGDPTVLNKPVPAMDISPILLDLNDYANGLYDSRWEREDLEGEGDLYRLGYEDGKEGDTSNIGSQLIALIKEASI